jgi:hypothetical protein
MKAGSTGTSYGKILGEGPNSYGFKDWVYFADREGRQFRIDSTEELVFYGRDLASIAI